MEYKDVIEMALGVAVLASAARIHIAGIQHGMHGMSSLDEAIAFAMTFFGAVFVCLGTF